MILHRIDIPLRYSDSDQMGVVYHANYFTFFELGRTALLESHGIDYYDIEKRGYLFPVREVSCTYYESITLGEAIRCETRIISMSKVKISFEHTLLNAEGHIKAKGKTAIVCVSKDTFQLARMDRHLPGVYQLKQHG
jgi:acyl-CoA thioester hydrolase